MFAQAVIMITALFFVVSIFATPFSVHGQTSGSTTQTGSQNQSSNTTVAGSGAFTPNTPLLPVCGIGITEETGDIEGCIVRGVYYLFLYPSAWLASMGGNVFDWFIGYTLSSDSYSQADFVEKGWRIVRDIANLSFIFVLLYIAFRYVLGLEGRDVQKTLLKIIGIALVINFSLFATRLIIDAGNILGRVFYERITVTGGDGSTTGYTPLSVGLISKVNPQRLLSSGMFAPTASITATTGQENNTLGELNDGASSATLNSTGFQILVLLTAAGVNLVLAYVFFSVGIFFVARTIGLWFQMIFSPIAFLSVAVPKVGGAAGGRFNFSTWLSTTFSLAFMVVVFMFLLYLTIMFLGVAFGSLIDAGENSSGLTLFLEVLIPFIVVAILLLAAKKQAKEMSGEFGSAMVKGLKMALIGALGAGGLALGGAAILGGVAGRQMVGRVGANMANKNATTAWGRAQKRAGKYLSTASFDARNVKIPQPLTSTLRSGLSYATGKEVDANDFRLRLTGKGTTKGGLETRRQKYVEDKVKDAENLVQNEDTKLEKGHYYDKKRDARGNVMKDANGNDIVEKKEITINISVNDAKRNLERKKFEVKNNSANKYEEKVQTVENAKKAYEKAERDLKNGMGTPGGVRTLKDSFESAEKELRDVEALWKQEENVYKAAENGLGQAKSEYYRDYSESIGTFMGERYDPRDRVGFASGAVEDKAYAQDKKNEAKDKKDKKEA